MIEGQPKPPLRIGTTRTVDMETGEVVSERRNSMTLLPPRPDVCQECAVDHPHDQPHNQQSVYYQMAFHATHGRWPTWSDAMAHCSEGVRTRWRRKIVEVMKEKGIPIPEDLVSPPTSPGA